MNKNYFKVIFTGKLTDASDINKVANEFAKRFRLPQEKALKILQAEKEVILNKKVEHVKAYKIKSVLEEIGMQARLERATIITTTTPKAEEATEKETTEAITKDFKDTKASESWAMEPIDSKPEETTIDPISNQTSSETRAMQQDASVSSNVSISVEDDSMGAKLKKVGGIFVGLGAGLLLILKKFGLFKLLKIGLLVGAASAIGFDSEEVCMDNERCEDAVDDQIDQCWENNGFDDIDWDNISDQEFLTLKPKIENSFIACFVYEDSGQRVFKSPIDLRIDLMDLCDSSELSNCNDIVEPQIHRCYEKSNLDRYFPEGTQDYYGVYENNPEVIASFYNCFVDKNGDKMFYYNPNE